jgi:hypothetical protein
LWRVFGITGGRDAPPAMPKRLKISAIRLNTMLFSMVKGLVSIARPLVVAVSVLLCVIMVVNFREDDQPSDVAYHEPMRIAVAADDSESRIAQRGEIEFPSGGTAQVNWQTLPIPSMKTTPPLADHYAMLREEAEMERPEAAFVLYKILESCKFAYEERRDLEVALHDLKSTHMLRAPEMDQPVLLRKEESIRNWETILRTSHEACGGISREQKGERNKWLEISASAGYPIAMREYSATIDEYEAGVSLDITRWHNGDAQALRSLAMRYWKNYDDGNKPTDKISAYAAMFAYKRIALENAARTGHEHDRRLERIQSELDSIGGRLREFEIEIALAEAEELVKSNQNCCFSF